MGELIRKERLANVTWVITLSGVCLLAGGILHIIGRSKWLLIWIILIAVACFVIVMSIYIRSYVYFGKSGIKLIRYGPFREKEMPVSNIASVSVMELPRPKLGWFSAYNKGVFDGFEIWTDVKHHRTAILVETIDGEKHLIYVRNAKTSFKNITDYYPTHKSNG